MYTVDVLIAYGIDLHIVHLAGENNNVADALSHFQNDNACLLVPGLSILPFTPPRDTLGATPQ
jgi:hypothetical protein